MGKVGGGRVGKKKGEENGTVNVLPVFLPLCPELLSPPLSIHGERNELRKWWNVEGFTGGRREKCGVVGEEGVAGCGGPESNTFQAAGSP